MKDNKKKKKSAQRHMPFIIPSENLQAYTNQVTQPQPNQPQSLPQSMAQPRSRSTQSIPQPQPQHQPQSTQSIPKPRAHLRFTQSMPQPRSRSTQSIPQPQPQQQPQPTQYIPQPQPQPQSTQSIPKPRPHLRFTQSMPQPRSRSTQSIPQPQPQQQPQPQPQSTQYIPQPQPQPQPQFTQSMPRSRSTQSIHQPQSTHIPTQVVHMEEYPIGNATHSSSSHVSGEDDGTRIRIVPEGDGFDRHKLVVSEIGSIIRTNLEEGKPSWKKVDKDTRDDWFNLFKKTFTWPPECKDKVRRNFEKRGAAKMSQIMQDAREDLDQKPSWMGDKMWGQLKTYWRSSAFKKKSSTNRRNRQSLDGASLHTGGSIPHRVHWKRMKQEKGTDPSLVDFYFRTHKKKDKNWVGELAKAAYDKFEQKKQELSSQMPTSPLGENEGDSQPQNHMPSDMDVWIHTMGVKKGKSVFGLGSVSEILLPTSSKLADNDNSEEMASLRSLVHQLNASLQRQEEEKLRMKDEIKLEMRGEFYSMLKDLGFAGSSSRPPSSPLSSSRPLSSPLYDHDIVPDSDEVVEESEGLSDAI